MPESNQYHVPAVISASQILALLAAAGDEPVRQIEIANGTGLSRSTTHNLLATLQHVGYVERDSETRRYRLGAALVSLGQAAAGGRHLVEAASERIDGLAADTGLSFALAQATAPGEAVIIDRAYPPTGLHVGITLGDSYGPIPGAIGKCLLAAMDPDDAEAIIKTSKISSAASGTIIKPADLLRDVEAVRDRGWASSVKEFNENHAVAAGIRGPEGRLELILLALGFPAQLSPKKIPSVGALLRETADAITEACGGDTTDRVHEVPANNGPSRAKGSKTA